MLSTDEIKKLTDYQVVVFKDLFASKDDIKRVETSLNTLHTAVANLATEKKDRAEEMATVNRRLKEAEDFLDKAAPKLELEFKH